MLTLAVLLLAQTFPVAPVLTDDAAADPARVETRPSRQSSELDPPLPKNRVDEIRTLLEVYDDDKECGVIAVELHLGDVIRRWEYGAGDKWETGFYRRFVHKVDIFIENNKTPKPLVLTIDKPRPRVFVELKDRPDQVNIKTGIKADVFLFFYDDAPALQFSGRGILDTGRGRGLLELDQVHQLPPDSKSSNVTPLIIASRSRAQSAVDRAKSPGITSEATAGQNSFFTKLWQNGSTLKIAFRGGTKEMRREFANTASDWTKETSLKLDFGVNNSFYEWPQADGRSSSDIRVAFDEVGSWSYIGTDSRIASSGDASLNIPLSCFNGTRTDIDGSSFRSAVLHEFGHALGLRHIFQHPEADCDFLWENEPGYVKTIGKNGTPIADPDDRRPGIYTILTSPPNNWDKPSVDGNMRPNAFAWMPSNPTPDSVMMYAFPQEYFREGRKARWYKEKPLTHLSKYDKDLIRLMYPDTTKEGNYKTHTILVDEAFASIDQPKIASVATVGNDDLNKHWTILKLNPRPDNSIEGAQDPGLRGDYRRSFNQSTNFVCRFKTKDAFTHSELGDLRKDQGFGTGFLVGPSHVLTCYHVMPKKEDADSSEIVFTTDNLSVTYAFVDNAIVCSSPKEDLDFSIMHVKHGTDGKPPGSRLGYYGLRSSYDKRNSLYANATLLNIIHYPGGQPEQQYELRGRSLKFLGLPPQDKFIAYDALTDHGSSGAPVFNDVWRVVALHRGKQQNDDESDKVVKNYSKGVRIDMIIQYIIDTKNKDLLSHLSLDE